MTFWFLKNPGGLMTFPEHTAQQRPASRWRIMEMTQEAIHIHGAYNPPPRDHGVIHEKGNLPDIEKALHMPGESILVGDFNLHHSTWEDHPTQDNIYCRMS